MEEMIKYIEDGVLEHKTRLKDLVKNFLTGPVVEDSISSSDALFLNLAC